MNYQLSKDLTWQAGELHAIDGQTWEAALLLTALKAPARLRQIDKLQPRRAVFSGGEWSWLVVLSAPKYARSTRGPRGIVCHSEESAVVANVFSDGIVEIGAETFLSGPDCPHWQGSVV